MWTSTPESPRQRAPDRKHFEPASGAGFQSVAEIVSRLKLPGPTETPLPFPAPTITVRKRNLKRVEAICLIREQRERGRPDLAYNARPFVLCGIPLRRPPRDRLTYTRHNGKLFLNIAAHPDFGLPMVSADCTCALLAFWLGRNLPPFPSAARSAI